MTLLGSSRGDGVVYKNITFLFLSSKPAMRNRENRLWWRNGGRFRIRPIQTPLPTGPQAPLRTDEKYFR
jgi:hypothetical protein